MPVYQMFENDDLLEKFTKVRCEIREMLLQHFKYENTLKNVVNDDQLTKNIVNNFLEFKKRLLVFNERQNFMFNEFIDIAIDFEWKNCSMTFRSRALQLVYESANEKAFCYLLSLLPNSSYDEELINS